MDSKEAEGDVVKEVEQADKEIVKGNKKEHGGNREVAWGLLTEDREEDK